jgi:hypothetical protein
MSRLIFGLASRLPTSTALLSLGQIRLPRQEQINSVAKRCGVLRGLTEHQLSHGQKQRPCRTSRRSANLYVSNCGHSRACWAIDPGYFGWTFGLPPGLPGGGITGVVPVSGVGAFIPLSMSGGQITP